MDYSFLPNMNWGRDKDYKEIMDYFSTLKRILIDKGFPVVIGEIGIYYKNAEKNSIQQFLYSIFSISSENEGILPCLWDISEKIEGDMNYYYNKETNEWVDKIIGENFLKISKGNFIIIHIKIFPLPLVVILIIYINISIYRKLKNQIIIIEIIKKQKIQKSIEVFR